MSPIPERSSGARPAVDAIQTLGAAHARLGEAEVENIVAARGEIGVDVNEIANPGDFSGEDDHVVAEVRSAPAALAESSALTTMASIITSRAGNGSERLLFSSIMRVSSAWSSRTPVDADAEPACDFQRRTSTMTWKLSLSFADRGVAGIDAMRYLASARGCGVALLEQDVAVVMEVAERWARAGGGFSRPSTMCGTAAAAIFVVHGDTRTSSDPARARLQPVRWCSERPARVGVVVID